MHVLHPPITSSAFLSGFKAEDITFLDSVASLSHLETGHHLFKKGGEADAFYIIRSGTLALQVPFQDRGPIPLMTLNPGDLIGWSWLFPPYKWNFDVLALNECELVSFETETVRQRCEADPGFGYRMMKALVLTLHDRLTATRLQLLRHHDD